MRMDDGRAIPTFIVQALRGEPLTVYGDGRQTRSVCYVDDMVEGLYRLLLSEVVEPVNLGNPDEVSVLQLAEEIRQLVGANSPIVFEPLPQDDPRVRRPDIRRAQELLGWEPTVERREGLRRTIADFRKRLGCC
jgi:dTDP-glucose 4,6-dehydratase